MNGVGIGLGIIFFSLCAYCAFIYWVDVAYGVKDEEEK